MAGTGEVVLASNHVEDSYLFHVPEDHHEVVSQELDVGDFTFVAFREHDGRHSLFGIFVYVVHEDFVGEGLEDCGCEVEVPSLVVVEAVSCEVDYLVADVRGVSALEAVDVVSVGNNLAPAEVSGVVCVLGVDKDLCFV